MALARRNAVGTLLGRVLVIVLVGFTAMRS
jgi:hypothetical protein